jgi:L-alanine-DL-glutamate epimerase-like enolase superfamily enzyme
MKVKVGGCALSDDVLRLRALRGEVGDAIRIRVDANQSWSESEAATALRGLAPLRLELCEQPIAAPDKDGLRRLRSLGVCRIAADESVPLLGATLLDSERPAVDVMVLKPMVLGGLLPAFKLAQAAAAAGVGSYVTGSLDGEVARAGAIHLAAALPSADFAHGLSMGTNATGRIELTEGSGLGLPGALL